MHAALALQTQHGLEEVPARQQSASQAIAEELVGVRGDLRYGAEQVGVGGRAREPDMFSLNLITVISLENAPGGELL